MESDGRIRSKDIGTAEVNSRALDNIRSSNYNGSHTNPENDPGTQGWQILKSGFMVINDAIFRGTVNAARIVSAIIESGAVRIISGGKIELGGDPETGTPATATLSETGIEVGPTSLTASGVTVGTDVEIDSTGLQVIGGYVTPIWPFTDRASTTDASLTTTLATIHSFVIDPPDWVDSLVVAAWGRGVFSKSGTGLQNLSNHVTIDAGGASQDNASSAYTADQNWAVGLTVPNSLTVPLSPAGRSVTVSQSARVNTGTNSSNFFSLNVLAFGLRS